MLDFIVENIWWFIIIGVAIILVAIGYIVDKFVINKNNLTKTTKIEPINLEKTDKELTTTNENNQPVETFNTEIKENPDTSEVFPLDDEIADSQKTYEKVEPMTFENNVIQKPIVVPEQEKSDIEVPQDTTESSNEVAGSINDLDKTIVKTEPLFNEDDNSVWKV